MNKQIFRKKSVDRMSSPEQLNDYMLEKAKTAKSAEELLAMAKAENIALTEEQAAKAFAELKRSGEIADEELDNVAGGCDEFKETKWKYNIGDCVIIKEQRRQKNCLK